jgi:hypothetical protein
MSMFTSEPQPFEPVSTTPSSEVPSQPAQQPAQPIPDAPPSQLPHDAQQVLNVLVNGDFKAFTHAYIQLLQQNSQVLVRFLNEKFTSNDKSVFEFLFNIFKENSEDEWGIVSFFTAIRELDITIKDQGISNYYHYMLLTVSPDQQSPIYKVVQELESNPPDKDLNDYFINLWNSLFGRETPKKTSGSDSKKGKQLFNIAILDNYSKETRQTIIFIVVALFIIFIMCGGYFINKYGKISQGMTTKVSSMGTATMIAPKLPKLQGPSLVSSPIDF